MHVPPFLRHYDAQPDVFPASWRPARNVSPPKSFPSFNGPAEADTTARTAIYAGLDSNVGAHAMAFTHTPFPEVNSALSVNRFGHNNPTRPFEVITGWLEDLFKPYLHLTSLSTTVEKVERKGEEWVLTLRKSDLLYRGKPSDYWWQETFDAVIVATGHYNLANIPKIEGIDEAVKAFPHAFEHSKAYRSPEKYVNKVGPRSLRLRYLADNIEQKVVVVGGNISASDLISDLHDIVSGPLYLSMRGRNEKLDSVYNLPNVKIQAPVKAIRPVNGITVEFTDGTSISGVEHVLFATGFRLHYPFLTPNPVTATNRLSRFYQHILNIDNPSLAVIGQCRAALSFRVYEYQAVAVARFFANHESKPLPSVAEQKDWEAKRLVYKADNDHFHEIAPDFDEYFNWLQEFAGKPAVGTDAYELPRYDSKWEELGLAILGLKDKYFRDITRRKQEQKQLQAKL